MADNVISNLSIVVNTNADEVAGKFKRLTSAVNGLGSAASSSADDMEDAADAADDMGMQTQEAGIRIGHAESFLRKFARALMNVSSRAIGSFVDAMKGGIAIIGKFIKQMARIAMIRAIRSMIKDIAQSFKDLYGWSRMFGTEYARSMDRINTAAVYLRNSFAAMVAPIINALAPAIDVIVDKIVDLFNFVNQIFAALSGAETYTVAKKVAQTWESTFDSTSSGAHQTTEAVKELKRTLLGFDEINKLDKNRPSSSSSGGGSGSSPYTPGYSTMFEEKPLEGFFKQVSDFTSKMPDWLKWLFGGAALIGGFKLITDFIPWLLGKLGELFSINIPDWLKWLFGPKGGGNDNGINIPDHIDIPDADIDVNLDKGDWSVLDEMPEQTNVAVRLAKDGWTSLSDWIDSKWYGFYTVKLQKLQSDWTSLSDWIDPKWYGYYTVKLQRLDSDWTSLADWISKSWVGYYTVKLQKLESDWTSLADWISKSWTGYYTVKLQRLDSDWTSLADWISKSWTGYYTVKLQKLESDWTSLVDWISKSWVGYYTVKLQKLDSDWTSLASWISKSWEGYYTVKLQKLSSDWTSLSDWISKSWVGYYTVKLQKFTSDWTSLASWIDSKWYGYYTVKLQHLNSDWTSLVDWISDTWQKTFKVNIECNDPSGFFGGASGGGGGTGGSGAGRGNWTVDVDVQMPTKEKSKGLLQKWWDALQWSANVEIGFAAKLLDKAGKVIDGTVGKALDWIFPGAKAEDNKIDVKVGATAGDGLTYDSSGKKFNVNYGTLNSSGTVNVNGVAGDGLVFSNTNHHYTLAGVDNASATVNVSGKTNGKTGLGMSSGSFMLKKVAGTSSTVSVSGSPVANMGLKLTKSKGFALVIKAAKATVKASVSVAKKSGLKFNKKNQVVPDTAGSTASVTAKVNTGKSDSAAVNALTAGSVTKGVNLSITAQTGGAGAYGLPGDVGVEDFGAQAIDSATSSLVAFLNVFNQLGKNVTKNLKVKVTDSNSLTSETVNALDWKSGNTKSLNMSIGLKSINNTVALALSGIGKTLTGVIQYTIEVAKKSVNWLADVLSSFFSPKKALGGVFSNGMWSSIPQYAGGTTNAHGSLFFAGEAGPEVVGHVGGRTEVLNRSQLAATMYSAVRSAMSGITLDANFYTGGGNEESDYDVMYQAMYDAMSAVMARGEERDREKVALLRSINDKDFQPEITASSIAQGMTRMNRRAGTTVVPVGT